jgi:hypothetical protein
MALHPWHVRYSTEARGYALALCFLPLLLLVLTYALARRGWRHWLLFGLLEFLLMYAWAGVAYPLVFINLAVVAILLSRSDRWMLVVRWLTASLLAAAAFVSLYAPHLPQIKHYDATHLWMKGLPMDSVWLHNLLAAPFTGILFHGQSSNVGPIVSWQNLLASSPVLTIAGFGLILLACAAGSIRLWVRNWRIAALVSAPFLAAIVSALHFKFVIGDELRVWYLIFTLPFLAISVAVGLGCIAGCSPRIRTSLKGRAGISAALLAVMIAALWPMNRVLMAYPAEDFKGVMAATRARYEDFHPTDRTEVITCWLWRYAALYDPRGDIHVRDEASLQQRMKEARAAGDELFFVVGYRALAESRNAGLLRLLDDPALFTRRAGFPAYEAIQELEVYQMNAAP